MRATRSWGTTAPCSISSPTSTRPASVSSRSTPAIPSGGGGGRSFPRARTCSRGCKSSMTRSWRTTCTMPPRLRLCALDGRMLKDLELPTLGSIGSISGERTDDEMFYAFTSFLYPTTIFRYDFKTGATSVFKAPTIDFDPSRHETKQVFYTSKDGTRVPMFITYQKGLTLDGSNPTYLYGYGGFHISLTPSLSVPMGVWLELGGGYAGPNLRGGGGKREEGRKGGQDEEKPNG